MKTMTDTTRVPLLYPTEKRRISDHISRDSGAGDAPMVSEKFNRCPGEYKNTEIPLVMSNYIHRNQVVVSFLTAMAGISSQKSCL